MKMIQTRKNTAYFIEKAKSKHGDKYDYSNTIYSTTKEKVEIICKLHGSFFIKANNHTSGSGCPKCKHNYRHSLETFINKSIDKHGNFYDYSKAVYKNNSSKLKIICPKHGIFLMSPNNHLSGQKCPMCKMSRLEEEIKMYLDSSKILYYREYTPIGFGKQRLDFYLYEYSIAIECQGRQHYIPVDKFGGIEAFELQKELDFKKKSACLNNNIILLEFPYFFKKKDKLDFFKQLNKLLDDKESNIIEKIAS